MARWRVFGAAASLAIGIVSCAKLDRHAGEVCGGNEIGTASCQDATHVLVCRSFTWHLDPCRGPDGCSSRGRTAARCDRSFVEEGDPCDDRDAAACARDHTTLLRCDGSVMVTSEHCRGGRGCHLEDPLGPPLCDRGAAEVGDLCDKEGTHCSGDGHTVLRCTSTRRYVLERTCRGPKGCYPSPLLGPRYLLCDVSVGDVGEPCGAVPEGGLCCSTDGKQENTCRGGTLAFSSSCPAGCVAQWGDDGRTYRIECRPSPRGE